MNTKRSLLPSLILAVCACATGGRNDDGPRRVVGTIEHYGDPVRVEAPADVARGADFRVTVVTYGGGCLHQGDTEVEINGLSAVVTPYDIDVTPTVPPGGACTLELRQYRHDATLRFDRAGSATITFRGRRLPSGEIISVTRTVRVR
ncbi:MAG TPA: hypothetical protein VF158_14140 [Longimicrobiales bacterium]